MLIDCDTCTARDEACGDCVMTVLLGRRARAPPSVRPSFRPLEFDESEQAALGTLAWAGLVPPLRLVVSDSPGIDQEIA